MGCDGRSGRGAAGPSPQKDMPCLQGCLVGADLASRCLPIQHTCSEGRFIPAAGSPGYSASAAGTGPPTPSVRLRLLALTAGANWPVTERPTAAPSYALGTAAAAQ